MSHVCLEFFPMVGWDLFQAIVSCIAELVERWVVASVQTLFFDKLPKPFDQIEIG